MPQTLKEKLAARRRKLKERSQGTGVFFLKEGTTRFRVLPIINDEDWAEEVTHFYLGQTVKGVFSRSTIGEDCPILGLYKKWKDSPKAEDKDKAKEISPKTKYLAPCIVYKDERGKEVDADRGVTLIQLPVRVYGNMLDAFLDPDLGDLTHPETGYDIKITRTGKGKNDTEYSMLPQRVSVLPDKWAEPVNLGEMLRKKALLSPESIQGKLDEYLALEGESSEPQGESKLEKARRERKERHGDA